MSAANGLKAGQQSNIADLVALICTVRNKVCPRSSYQVGGTVASSLFVFPCSNHEEMLTFWNSNIWPAVLAAKEFEQQYSYTTTAKLVEALSGHVVIILGDAEESLQAEILQQLTTGKTNLCFQLRQHQATAMQVDDDNNEDINSPIARKVSNRLQHSEHIFEHLHLELKIWYMRTLKTIRTAQTTTGGTSISLGFNGQPSVASRRQFLYLWNMLQSSSTTTAEEEAAIEEGKLRVLQRLATKDLLYNRKLSAEEWNEHIEKALKESKNDTGIYSLIREQTLAKTLKDSLNEVVVVKAKDATSSAGPTEDDNEGDRSSVLVDMTMECLPPNIRNAPYRYVKNMLDYGCAEGAITATLGKRLGLSSENVYGADVRSISSKDFTFIQLPSEDESTPPPLGSILPTIENASIYLINTAMVFHHVTHIEEVLLELRRIIHPMGMLIIREHDCRNKGVAAFLDIVHGLFSLAWKDPIEWPGFLDEYKAFYRSREQWDHMLTRCGFMLRAVQPRAYSAVDGSVYRNGSFNNVTRAYYAVYLVNSRSEIGRRVSVDSSNNMSILSPGGGKARVKDEGDEPAAKRRKNISFGRPAVATNSVALLMGHNNQIALSSSNSLNKAASKKIGPSAAGADESGQFVLCESRSQPGKFFKFYPANNKCEWFYEV